MGIYDRDYYRGQGSSFLGSLTLPGQLCKWLIILNVAVFVLQLLTEPAPDRGPRFFPAQHDQTSATELLLLDVDKVMEGQVWRLLTSAFLHDPRNLWHIVMNMWFLWMFGPRVEERYGPREFLAFYLGAAVFGSVTFVILHYVGMPGTRCLGASGAVTAVMVLCALNFPHLTILLFFILPVPIWVCILFQLGLDAYAFLTQLRGLAPPSGTAVTVHLGGAAFAYLYFKTEFRLTDLWSGFRLWSRQRSRPRLRVYRDEPVRTPVTVGSSSSADVDAHMEAMLDAVLEKVARSGKDSLTEAERQILLRASEVYRRRRT
jgi:membrane associated rhomboid family serine protease